MPLGRIIPVAPAVVTEPAGSPVALTAVDAEGTTTLNAIVPVDAGTTLFEPAPCMLIHQVPLEEIPQGLMKLASVTAAGTEPSDMRLITLYDCPIDMRQDAAAKPPPKANFLNLATVELPVGPEISQLRIRWICMVLPHFSGFRGTSLPTDQVCSGHVEA